MKVLIADTDASQRLALSRALGGIGCTVRATGPAATLVKWLGDPEVALAILDTEQTEEPVFEALRRIHATRPGLPVILTGGRASLTAAVRAVEAGAFDHIAKPYRVEDLVAVVTRALSAPRPHERARSQARARRDDHLPMIGRSALMQDLYRTAARLVASDLTVLIVGESGTGKAPERPTALYDHIIKAVELPLLQATLQATQGNKIRAAEILGINRNTLKKKMEELGLETRRAMWSEPTVEPLIVDRRRSAA